MTKIIFILLIFFGSTLLADNKFKNDFKCLKSLSTYFDKAPFIDLGPRNTMLFFLKETNEYGIYSHEMNPAILQLEDNRVVVCALQLDHQDTVKFMVNDQSGSGQAFLYTDKESPHFRPLGLWSSTMPTLVGGAPDRNCKDVSGEMVASQKLKKIILSALKKDMQKKSLENYILPDYCRSAASISQYDIEMLKRELAPGTKTPTTASPTNAAPSSSNNMKKATKNAEDSL